jgi:hypothetical protein
VNNENQIKWLVLIEALLLSPLKDGKDLISLAKERGKDKRAGSSSYPSPPPSSSSVCCLIVVYNLNSTKYIIGKHLILKLLLQLN